MGNTIRNIQGAVSIVPPLNDAEQNYLRKFLSIRHVDYADGPFVTDAVSPVKDASAHNRPPEGQPNMWCHWLIDDTGSRIVWDGGVKFHDPAEWLRYLIDTFLRPGALAQVYTNESDGSVFIPSEFEHFTFDHEVIGSFTGMGTDVGDVWSIIVLGNRVFHHHNSDLMIPVMEQIIDAAEIDNPTIVQRLRKMAREEDAVTRRAHLLFGAGTDGTRLCRCQCPASGTDMCHCEDGCACEPDCGFCNAPADPNGLSYADRMNEPPTPETIVALYTALKSDNPARFKRVYVRDEDVPAEVKATIAEVREWYDTHDTVTGEMIEAASPTREGETAADRLTRVVDEALEAIRNLPDGPAPRPGGSIGAVYATMTDNTESAKEVASRVAHVITRVTDAGFKVVDQITGGHDIPSVVESDDEPGCEVVASGMTVCVNPEAGYAAMMAEQDAEEAAYRKAFPDGEVRYDEDADRGSWKSVRAAIRSAQKTAAELLDSLEDAEREIGQRWNLWSHKHQLWWAPNNKGYVSRKEEAGMYSTAEVVDILRHSFDGWVPESDHRSVPNTIAVPAS